MKTIICHCVQCRAAKKEVRKRNRVQTKQIRAARHRVKRLIRENLKNNELEMDNLQKVVSVDYYA